MGQLGSDPNSPCKGETCQHSDEIQASLTKIYFLKGSEGSQCWARSWSWLQFASPCRLVCEALVSLLIAFLRSSRDRLQPFDPSLSPGAKSLTFGEVISNQVLLHTLKVNLFQQMLNLRYNCIHSTFGEAKHNKLSHNLGVPPMKFE